MLYAGLAVLSMLGVLLFFMRRDIYKRAKEEEYAKEIRRMLDDNRRVSAARNIIISDPSGDVASKLRDKYERR